MHVCIQGRMEKMEGKGQEKLQKIKEGVRGVEDDRVRPRKSDLERR